MEKDLERKRQFLTNAAYYLFIVATIYVTFRYIIYSVTPFVIAALITLMLKKPIDGIAQSFNIPRRATAGMVVMLFYVVLSILMTWAFTHLMWMMFNWLADIPARYADSVEPAIENLLNWYSKQIENFSPNRTEYFTQLTNSVLAKMSEVIVYISQQALKMAQGLAFNIPKYIIGAVFCIVATVFMSLDFPGIKHFVLEQFSHNQQRIILDSKRYVVETFGRIITSYALIMFITMTELYVGLTIIAVPDAMVLSILIAMFDILPALGTGGIMLPWVLIEIMDQDYTFALQLFVIYVTITIVRNFLEPKIVGDSIGLHPVLMLMSIFLGVSVFGIIGVLIIPFTLIVIKKLNDSGRIHIFKSAYLEEDEEFGFFELKRRAKLKREIRKEKDEAEEEMRKLKKSLARREKAGEFKERVEEIGQFAKETLLKTVDLTHDENDNDKTDNDKKESDETNNES